jgi:hypothetical protein
VQLELPRDAALVSRDAGVDARVIDAARLDAAHVDAAMDAPGLDAPPPLPCEGPGVVLGAVASTDPARAPSIGLVGAGAARREVVLVPPSARAPASSVAHLFVLDDEGTVLSERELAVPAPGGAALITRADASTAPGEAAFELVLGDRLQSIDLDGLDVGAPRTLPAPLSPVHEGRAALVAADRLVYVAEGGAIVSVDLASGAGAASTSAISDTDRLYVAEGSVVVNRGEPTLEVWELAPSLDGSETLHLSSAETSYAGRVLGALRASGERRWVAHGDGEFRAPTDILRVGDDGTLGALVSERLVGPFQSMQRDGLVVIETSSGSIVAIDPTEATIRTLLEAGFRDLAGLARLDGDIALLTMEAGDPDAQLVYRCLR